MENTYFLLIVFCILKSICIINILSNLIAEKTCKHKKLRNIAIVFFLGLNAILISIFVIMYYGAFTLSNFIVILITTYLIDFGLSVIIGSVKSEME